MYGNSILVNVCFLGLRGQLGDAFTGEALSTILNWKVILLILNNAAIGIVTSLFLKVCKAVCVYCCAARVKLCDSTHDHDAMVFQRCDFLYFNTFLRAWKCLRQKLNSILKTFASALELLFTAILSWCVTGPQGPFATACYPCFELLPTNTHFFRTARIFFGIPLTFQTLVAIAIVSGKRSSWMCHNSSF